MKALPSISLGVAAAGALFAVPAHACVNWSLAGPFSIDQANGLTVVGSFQQDSDSFGGQAKYYDKKIYPDGADFPLLILGTLETGEIRGNQVRFTVQWHAAYESDWASTGVYEGTISRDGKLQGINFDLREPGNKVSWTLRAPVVCKDPPHIVVIPGVLPGVSHAPPAHPAPVIVMPGALPGTSGGSGRPIKHIGPRPATSGQTCLSGFVWRMAGPRDWVCVSPEARSRSVSENTLAASRVAPTGGPACMTGFVWREAFPSDLVCVSPEIRTLVRSENQLGPSRVVQDSPVVGAGVTGGGSGGQDPE